jgi:hypothetical protein
MDCIAIFANGAATKFFNSPVTYFLLRLFDWRPPAQGGHVLIVWRNFITLEK